MICDLQKANMWKRISAYLCDVILLSIVVVGLIFALSAVLGYDGYSQRLEAAYEEYESVYGVNFSITSEEYAALSEEEMKVYDDAIAAMQNDDEVSYVYTMVINLTLLMITFGILGGYLILEFIVPLILKNGQTLGKKVFGIGVMRTDGVKVTPIFMFMRTILGKYTVETMVPVLVVIMIYFNLIGYLGLILIGGLLVVQIVLMVTSKTNAPIHDRLASTVTVDMQSQMIFESTEELTAYKNKLQAEKAETASY